MRNHEFSFRDVKFYWESHETDTRVAYLFADGRGSLSELIAHLRTVVPGISLDDVTIGGCLVQWTRPATETEMADREEWQARSAARHEEWERRTYARLKEKFEGTGA